MLSYFYKTPFEQMLKDYIRDIKSNGNKTLMEKEYTLFYPCIGKDYNKDRELLVVGQATRNWNAENNKWNIKNAEKDFENIIDKSIDCSSEDKGKCPLQWVNDDWDKYKFSHSFFWNVTYKLVKQNYGRTDENWTNIIAWSNLLKIAPAEENNPKGVEFDIQIKNAAKLFKLEIEKLEPKNCLLITNLNTWAKPILDEAEITYKEVKEKYEYVEATAYYKGCNIIITKRPFVGGNREIFNDEVSKFLIHKPSKYLFDNTDFGEMMPGVE